MRRQPSEGVLLTGTAPEGVDIEPVTAWITERDATIVPPLSFDLIKGGHSNLTFAVTDAAGRRIVLRRPPLGQVLATAHDMGREHRIIAALADTDVPVPPVIGLCEDNAVNGAPFYVMDYVEGSVIRDQASADPFSPEQRGSIGRSLVDVLARIHAVDVDAVGLGALSRREGYIERQLRRWYGQWEKSRTRDLPVIDEVFERLRRAIPEQGTATIVHGDYRLDNCMIGSDDTVAAVLDWEICTLGDPLADVGLLLVYWGDRDTQFAGVPDVATLLEGFPDPAEVLEGYGELTGRDLSQIDFYVAFGFWKLACIVEGVYARYLGGAMGERDKEAFAPFATQVELMAEAAREAIGRLE